MRVKNREGKPEFKYSGTVRDKKTKRAYQSFPLTAENIDKAREKLEELIFSSQEIVNIWRA